MPPPDAGQDPFRQHVVPHLDVLFRVARTLTRNDADAEDLVQDTLIRAYRSIARFDGQHPRAWLLTILRNTHINRNRRRRPQLFRDGDDANDRLATTAGPDRADIAVEATFDAAVEQALAELDEPFRRVIQLVDVKGLTYAEAATALEIPVGTVMSRLHRARNRMRRRLDASGLAPRHPR